MLRTARFTLVVVMGLLTTSIHAQEPIGVSSDGTPRAITGAPFSAVGTMQTIRRTMDGNRFVRTTTTRYYRDGQGRVRTEREIEASATTANGHDPFRIVTINDKVSGQISFLDSNTMTAHVLMRGGSNANQDVSGNWSDAGPGPNITTVFDGKLFLPSDSGWAAPVSLGEKSIDGINAAGTRRVLTIAAGAQHNDKPITVTVEQWYSASLGVTLLKTAKASTGGEGNFKLDQIVQAEPDASLFKVPAGYKEMTEGGSAATVTATSGSTTSN